MSDAPSLNETIGKQGAAFRQSLIESMAKVWGDHPSNAARISHERERELWRTPTSPAAIKALEMGGSLEEAEEANRLWAQALVAQRAELIRGGGTPEQVEKAGLTDEQIFAVCRKHAYELGKANARSDPAKEVKYHEEMREKVRAATPAPPTISDLGPTQPQEQSYTAALPPAAPAPPPAEVPVEPPASIPPVSRQYPVTPSAPGEEASRGSTQRRY